MSETNHIDWELLEQDHGKEFTEYARNLAEAQPHLAPFNIISQTELALQQNQLMDLAAQNATPFDSSRDWPPSAKNARLTKH